jgi:predicted nucleotidyltransferase
MSKTALEMDAKELRGYSPASQTKPALSDERTARARAVAQEAADLLKRQFHATRVVLFGSLAHGLWFTPWSDIDLAASGILPARFYEPVAAVSSLDRDWTVNLVDMATAPSDLRHAIEEEGIEL